MRLTDSIAIVYIAAINILSFLVMGIDKKKAVRGEWRISERTLFFLALVGGSVGAWLGMYAFRHKTKHLKFVIGMPLILALQIAAIYLL